MAGRIGAKGQVVIPKALRDRANLHPGDEVDFELDGDRITLVARRTPTRLGGRFAHSDGAPRARADDPRRQPDRRLSSRAWPRGLLADRPQFSLRRPRCSAASTFTVW
jgi:AbrB family looped-hinge helix DNA binding protein